MRGETAIVILPFDNLLPSGEDGELVEGLLEDLIYYLSRVPGLRVMARHSAERAKLLGWDHLQIREALDVSHLLTGSIRAKGELVRVGIQLSETENGFLLASERFDLDRHKLHGLQEALAHSIAEHLQLQLKALPSSRVQALDRAGPEAYPIYLRARLLHNRNDPAMLSDAVTAYEQSIAHAPGFAPAHAGKARCLAYMAIRGAIDFQSGMAQARQAAFRAIELDPQSEEAHLSLGEAWLYLWEWDKAERSLRLARELNPGNALVHRSYARYLIFANDLKQARKEMELALRLDPLSVEIQYGLADVLLLDGALEECKAVCRQILERQPDYRSARNAIGYALMLQGKLDEAEVLFDEIYTELGRGDRGLTPLAAIHGMRGEVDRARAALEVLKERAERDPSGGLELDLALIYMCLGKNEEAIYNLSKLRDKGHGFLPFLYRHPSWRKLQDTAGFEALMAETGLPAHLKARKSTAPAYARTIRSDTSEDLTLDLADLLLAQALDNYTRICWIERGELRQRILRLSLKSLAHQVADLPFLFRCHKSFLVNTRQPFAPSGNSRGLKLHSDHWKEPIPVSRSLHKEALEHFSKK